MFDLQASWQTLSDWYGFVQNHVPMERRPNPVLWSSVAVLLGVVLTFWGARLLRSVYVLLFMVIGGSIGVRLAGVRQVDILIGLTLGAGLAALIAFLLFRWWVGLTTGLIAAMILIAAGAPRLNQELTDYNDVRRGVGTGDFSKALPAHESTGVESWDQLRQFTAGFSDYLVNDRRAELIKTGVGLGLVWLLGTLAGLLLPRLIMIGGTALVGTFLLALGSGVLLSARLPSAWSAVLLHWGWFLALMGVLLLAGVSYQTRARRGPIPVKAPLPAAA